VQTPEPLFAALEKILERGLIPEADLWFIWAGRDAPFVHRLAEQYHITPIFSYIGMLSKNEADRLLYRSHLLFLTIGMSDNVSQGTVLTGELFPYLASGVPILAVIPDGNAKKMLEKYSENSYVIPSGDIDEITDPILDAYAIYRSGKCAANTSEKTLAFRNKYNFRRLTGELSEIFEKHYHRN